MAHRGYFVIADITGYTAFMTGSELDHAQDILKTLFSTILDHIKPPLIISNFQGDAILTYAPEGSFKQGQTLLELVENIYCAFARMLENMHRNTTCTCQACANMTKLDLKLFVHQGEYLLQDMRGKEELSGPDVIIAHRMMKNDVKEKTGLKAYTLFTDKAVDALGLQDFTSEMKFHSETYDHIGEVKMYAYCLKTMWEREREKRRDFVEPEKAWLVVEADIPAPPAVVWDYLNMPEYRRRAQGAHSMLMSGMKSGRMGVGSIHHCAHGKDAQTDFLIVDWRPFDYYTEQMTGLPLNLQARMTTRFTPIAGGTRITVFMDRPTTSSTFNRVIAKAISPMLKMEFRKSFVKVNEQVRAVAEEEVSAGKIVPPTSLTPAVAAS